MKKNNPLSSRPEKVVMIGLGVSAADYLQNQVGQELIIEYDEIWTCNMGLRVFRHDKVWVMDDLRAQAKKFPVYGRLLATHDRPIITSQPYPEFPQSWRYPIEEVVKEVGDDFLRNTVCYAIAYAMVTGVKDLTLYGCDFWYPQMDIREEGSMNAAYLLGCARHFGMTFHLPPSTTLLSAHISREAKDGKIHRPLYGYAKQPLYNEEDLIHGPGTKPSASVRASEGNYAGSADGSEPIRQAQVGSGRTATICASGEGLQRRRGRGRPRRSTGVVLGGSAQNDGAGASGVRASLADGNVQSACKYCHGPTHETYNQYKDCERAHATGEAQKALDVRP